VTTKKVLVTFVPGDPLHGQHQEGVHGQRLAHRTRFQLSQDLDELGILASGIGKYIGMILQNKAVDSVSLNGERLI
jgi:hypothetical protein